MIKEIDTLITELNRLKDLLKIESSAVYKNRINTQVITMRKSIIITNDSIAYAYEDENKLVKS